MTEATTTARAAVDQAPESGASPDFWFQLIDEKMAAKFLNLTTRSMQARRQRGDGPRFVRISARCIRYRRSDLRAWADALMRKSTADPGQEAA